MVMKVCVVTATRAEYGLLRPLMEGVRDHPDFELQLIISGTHLSPEFGLTWQTIVDDGFSINEQVDMLVSGDTKTAAAKSLGLMILGMADALRRQHPDLLIILGDRYEMLGVATAAQLFNIPVVHLHGGEITEGAIDDAFRHAITKLSCVHFTSTEEYRCRVIQMGEQPKFVHNVGAIGLENIRRLAPLSKDELAASLGLDLTTPYFLVTYHPVTAVEGDALRDVDFLMEALLSIDSTQAIITLANADVGGRTINQRIGDWVRRYPERLYSFSSLGQLRYLSAAMHSLGVVGNSSSGIIEAPSLGVGTLNIGLRQEGRAQASSIINCQPSVSSIQAGLRQIRSVEFLEKLPSVKNPYGDGRTVEKIIAVLAKLQIGGLVKKKFHDHNVSS